MSQLANEVQIDRRHLEGLYAPIRAELDEVDAILRRELRSDHAFVDDLARHAFRLGGKRLRPALLLLTAKAVSEITQEHLVLAAVVEMIHTATLVHDDVLDEATLRRHVDTVNARWSNQSSILLGDYLFTHAFYLASTTESTYACRVIGQATNVVCEGELRQIESRGNFTLTETEYLEIIQAKTAELCSCCCRLGAHYAGASAALEESLARYGRCLGAAFQIVDDLLDLSGNETTTGKSLGTDLAQHKLTLPVIHLLRCASDAERRSVLDVLTRSDDHRRSELEPWFERQGSLSYARDRARSFGQFALEELRDLAPSPARDVLRQLPKFVVDRNQ